MQQRHSDSLELPDIRNVDAWNVLATDTDATLAVMKVVKDVAAPKDAKANALVVRLLVEEGATNAELAYCARMLRRDQELGKALRFQKPLTFFDFARWIYPIRELRAKLHESNFTQYELNKIISQYPSLLKKSNFGIQRFTANDEPIYKFFRSAEGEVRASMIQDPLKPFEGPMPVSDRVKDMMDISELCEVVIEDIQPKPPRKTRSERLRALSSKNFKPEAPAKAA